MTPSSPNATKVKVAILLVNRQFIRSWIDSGLIKHLEANSNFEIHLFSDAEIHKRLPTSNDYKTVDLGEIQISKRTKHTVAMGLAQMSSRSRTFRFKLIRQFLPETLLFARHGNYRFKTVWFSKSFRRIIGNSLHNRMTLCYFFPPLRALINLYLKVLNEKPALPKEISDGDFEWLIIPSASAIGYTTDFLEGANAIGLKTLIAIDNWDHLTGKSIYPIKPDYFTVMGKRCVEHAVQIHECDATRVLPFGLPRFDIYREIEHNCNESFRVNKPRVLYCGFSLAHAEKQVVSSLANYLESKYGVGSIEVHYRPHPGPLPRYDGSTITNSNIEITSYKDLNRTAMPDMDEEFLNAILQADVVVGAPTTLILESLAIRKKCVLDLTNDGYHRTSAGNSASWHTHMLDLTDIKELPRGNTIDELHYQVDQMLQQPTNCLHLDIENLYNTSEKLYRDQLLQFLLTAQHSKID
jgi:hypothetical protein